jgi:hypothetical protein
LSFLQELKFSTSQVEAKPGKFDRIGTTFGKIPESGLFHIVMLRAGAVLSTQSRQDAKQCKGRRSAEGSRIRAEVVLTLSIGH